MTLLFRLKGLLLRLLPERFFYLLSKFLGYVWFYVFRIRRETAIKNVCLSLNLTKNDAERIVRDSMVGLCASFLEFVSQRKLKINLIGYEENKELLKKGAIVVTAHTGNWDVLEQIASQEKIKLGVLSRKSGFLPIQSFLNYVRKSRNEVVFLSDTSVSSLIKFLKSGGVLGVAIDQNMPPKHGRPALFFGQRVNTTFAPQILSFRSGLPIIPVFIRRIEMGRYEVLFYQHCIIRDFSDTEIENSMNYLNLLLEKFIRKYPDQWLWVHRRFKPLRQ